MKTRKKQENKVEENEMARSNQRITGIPASEFSLYTDKKNKSNFLMYGGKKKLTAYKYLNKRMLDFIKETFTVVVSGEYFNFDPVEQEEQLFNNPAAINRMNLEDARETIENAIRFGINDVLDRPRRNTEVSLSLNDFKLNKDSNQYETDYDLRVVLSCINPHVEISFDDIIKICRDHSMRVCENTLNLARPFYNTFIKDLKFEDIFPGANTIFKIQISPLIHSLLDSKYRTILEYDWKKKTVRYAFDSSKISHAVLIESIKCGEFLCAEGLFEDCKTRILKTIDNVEYLDLRQIFHYTYILALYPHELMDSIPHLGGESFMPTNPLYIQSKRSITDWGDISLNQEDVFGDRIYSFHRYFDNPIYNSEDYDPYNLCCIIPENDLSVDINDIYIIPIKQHDSNNIKILFYFSNPLKRSTQLFMTEVLEKDVELAIFFLWAYFASEMPFDFRNSETFETLLSNASIGRLDTGSCINFLCF